MRLSIAMVIALAAVFAAPRHGEAGAARERALALGLGDRAAASLLLSGRPRAEWVAAAGRGGHPRTLLNPAPGGWWVRGFGDGEAGGHLALDIGGAMRSRIRAAAGGIVGYSGDGVRGYGHLVLVVHPGGWVTGYAHLDSRAVVAGQRIARGQTVGRLGQTGIARGPHLHFELMVDGRMCDAAPLLRPAPERRDGRSVEIAQLVWRGRNPPSGLRCQSRSHRAGQTPDEPAAP